MNRTELLAVLRRLVSTPTAPYNELEARDTLHAIISEHGLHYQTDGHGNTIVRVRRGMPRTKVAFVAHLDHPALRVVSKKASRFVCEPQGGFPSVGLVNAKVFFQGSSAQRPTGRVCSAKAVKRGGRSVLTQAVVQVTSKGIEPAIGDFAVLDLAPLAQKGNRLKLRVADDLAGVAAVVAALVRLSRRDAACEALGVFTRAEEVGFHGAVAAALGGLVSRESLVVSVECSQAIDGVELGKGAVVRLGDRSGPFDPRAVALVRNAARVLAEAGANFQSALMEGGSCEATAFGAFGYRVAGIAMPMANYHNQGPRTVAAEEIDVRDFEGAVDLIVASAERAGAGIDDVDLLRNELVRNSEEGRQQLRIPAAASTSFLPESV